MITAIGILLLLVGLIGWYEEHERNKKDLP